MTQLSFNIAMSALPPSLTPIYQTSASTPAPDERLASLQHQLIVTRLVIQRVVMVVVVLFGCAGNALNIAVLTRRWMKSSTNYYLTALAVYDTLYLLLALTLTWTHYPAMRAESWYIRYKDPYGRPLNDACSNTGVWLTLTFTIERYIGVCYPMRGKVWCTPQRAKYVILVVCLLAGLLTFPEFFEYSVVEEWDEGRNATGVRRVETGFGQWPAYRFGYYYANQVLFTFLPLLLLLLFNSLLIRAVMVAARQRNAMTKSPTPASPAPSTRGGPPRLGGAGGKAPGGAAERQQRDQQRITVMLISVVIVFLVCQLPQAVQKLYMVYLGAHPALVTPVLRTVLTISANYCNLLVTLNCSTNFVLYSSFSTKFRRTFRRLFCQCWWCRSCAGGAAGARGRPAGAGLDPLLSEVGTVTMGPTAIQMYVIDDGRTSYTNIANVDDVMGNGGCRASMCVGGSPGRGVRVSRSRSPVERMLRRNGGGHVTRDWD